MSIDYKWVIRKLSNNVLLLLVKCINDGCLVFSITFLIFNCVINNKKENTLIQCNIKIL